MQFIVHVGPPKTGTSAIQNWLVNNKGWLATKGVYYPDHEVDTNGVSSGNLLALYDRKKNGELTLNKEKLKLIVSESKSFGCDSILLSSEFFFSRIDDLVDVLSNVLFVAYVRSPLELKESGYNQSIKRHGQIKKFPFEHRLPSRHLDALAELYKKYGAKYFKIRFYHKDLFHNGNIVDDFLLSLPINTVDGEVSTKIDTINSSYCAEAMEFKRWTNQLGLSKKLDRQLDIILQGYDKGTSHYSLIPPKYYVQLRSQCVSKLIDFREVCREQGINQFISVVREQSQKKYYSQECLVDSVKVISNFLYCTHSEFYKLLLLELKERCSQPEEIELFKVYVSSLSIRERMSHHSILFRLKLIIKTLIRQI